MRPLNLSTPVALDPLPPLTYSDRLVCLGSCFASEMGLRLRERHFDALVNPYGPLYNPLSLSRNILRALDGRAEDDLADGVVARDGGYCHLDCHGQVWAPSPGLLAREILRLDRSLKDYLSNARFLLLTLGSAWLYQRPDGCVVGNCHRIPEQGNFTHRLAQPDEVLLSLRGLLGRLWTLNPELQILLTVSPIRHLRDGLRDNAVSKSVLLYAAYMLQQESESVHYVPAYEILMDELRDYRFYAEDMIHPSALALNIVWERLLEAWCDERMRKALTVVEHFNRAAAHRPNPRIAEAESQQQAVLRKLASDPALSAVGLDLWAAYQRLQMSHGA